MGPVLAGQVHSHASIAVGVIDRLVAEHQHHNAILRTIADRHGKLASLDEADTLTRPVFDQIQATRDDLQRLADDACQQGPHALSDRDGHHVKIDLSLKAPPADADAVTLMGTLHVINVCYQRNCRDVGDQLQRLLIPLSKVADPAALLFASQLEQLATQVRPPGAPRGPYAPQHL